MALFKSHLVTQMSGSTGGTTYATSHSGMYTRARSTPVNPSTPRQQSVRNLLAQLSAAWKSLGSAAQADWNTVAKTAGYTNRLGDPIPISGQNLFIACNSAGLQSTDPMYTGGNLPTAYERVDVAPALWSPPNPGAISVAYTTGAGMTIDFDATQPWATHDLGMALVYEGSMLGTGRTFHPGPFRLAGAIIGDTGSPPTSPFVISAAALPFPPSGGALTSAQLVILDGFGNFSYWNSGPLTVS